jgi:hypothetical protein
LVVGELLHSSTPEAALTIASVTRQHHLVADGRAAALAATANASSAARVMSRRGFPPPYLCRLKPAEAEQPRWRSSDEAPRGSFFELFQPFEPNTQS